MEARDPDPSADLAVARGRVSRAFPRGLFRDASGTEYRCQSVF